MIVRDLAIIFIEELYSFKSPKHYINAILMIRVMMIVYMYDVSMSSHPILLDYDHQSILHVRMRSLNSYAHLRSEDCFEMTLVSILRLCIVFIDVPNVIVESTDEYIGLPVLIYCLRSISPSEIVHDRVLVQQIVPLRVISHHTDYFEN